MTSTIRLGDVREGVEDGERARVGEQRRGEIDAEAGAGGQAGKEIECGTQAGQFEIGTHAELLGQGEPLQAAPDCRRREKRARAS